MAAPMKQSRVDAMMGMTKIDLAVIKAAAG